MATLSKLRPGKYSNVHMKFVNTTVRNYKQITLAFHLPSSAQIKYPECDICFETQRMNFKSVEILNTEN